MQLSTSDLLMNKVDIQRVLWSFTQRNIPFSSQQLKTSCCVPYNAFWSTVTSRNAPPTIWNSFNHFRSQMRPASAFPSFNYLTDAHQVTCTSRRLRDRYTSFSGPRAYINYIVINIKTEINRYAYYLTVKDEPKWAKRWKSMRKVEQRARSLLLVNEVCSTYYVQWMLTVKKW